MPERFTKDSVILDKVPRYRIEVSDLRLLSAAGRLVRGGRRLRLRLAERWPWALELTAAVTRLQALPSG